MRHITIKDIARIADVSYPTASRALSGSFETKRENTQAYSVNLSTSRLSRQRSRTQPDLQQDPCSWSDRAQGDQSLYSLRPHTSYTLA